VPVYQLRAVGEDGREFMVVADRIASSMQVEPRTWVDWMHDLHVELLLGSAYGMQLNGVGAALLLLLSGSGLRLWWQGVKS